MTRATLLAFLFSVHAVAADTVAFLGLEESAREMFERWPPSPLDYAAVIKNLRTAGHRRVAFADALSWADLNPTHERVLQGQLREASPLFAYVADANPLTPLPPGFAARLPAMPQVVGTIDSLPAFSGMAAGPAPAFWPLGEAAWTRIEFGPQIAVTKDYLEAPLLARFGDKALPAFPLVAALRGLSIPLEKVQITLGEAMLFEDAWRVPIDGSGRYRAPWDGRARLSRMALEDITPLEIDKAPSAKPFNAAMVVLGDDEAAAKRTQVPGGQAISQAEIQAFLALSLMEQAVWREPEPPPAAPVPQPEVSTPEERPTPAPSVSGRPMNPALWAIGLITFVSGLFVMLRATRPTQPPPSAAAEPSPAVSEAPAVVETSPQEEPPAEVKPETKPRRGGPRSGRRQAS